MKVTLRRSAPVTALLAAALIAGCAPLSALRTAATPLDAFTLTAPAPAAPAAPTRGRIEVEPPAAPAALASDRIVVKPNPLQVQVLPGMRWIEPAPDLVQSLVIDTLQDSGAFRHVGGRAGGGPFPDYILQSELRRFEAEPVADAAYRVSVALRVTLVRESDGQIVGTRLFAGTAQAGSTDGLAVAAAFDAATRRVLVDLADWLVVRTPA